MYACFYFLVTFLLFCFVVVFVVFLGFRGFPRCSWLCRIVSNYQRVSVRQCVSKSVGSSEGYERMTTNEQIHQISEDSRQTWQDLDTHLETVKGMTVTLASLQEERPVEETPPDTSRTQFRRHRHLHLWGHQSTAQMGQFVVPPPLVG